MAEQSFKQAFAEARRKFRKEPTEGNYTFTWPKGEGGKKYNILQAGETKKGVMEKYGKSSAPEKSPRPSARPSKSESSGSSSSGPKKRLGYEPNTDTTDDARASRGSGRTSSNSKSTSSSSGPSTRPNNKPKDSRTQLERDRERMGNKLGKIKDFLFPGRDYAKVPIGEWKPEKKYKGGMVGASNPPTQKGTPRYKK
jgi:hypothetical protein